jgi:hypothetical protein
MLLWSNLPEDSSAFATRTETVLPTNQLAVDHPTGAQRSTESLALDKGVPSLQGRLATQGLQAITGSKAPGQSAPQGSPPPNLAAPELKASLAR